MVADNVVKITVDIYKPAAFILGPITIYDSLVVTILDNCDSILRQYYKNSRN